MNPPQTWQVDARTLGEGDVFAALPLEGWRRVVRTRAVTIWGASVLEVLSGRADGHPGSLCYSWHEFGARVTVPVL